MPLQLPPWTMTGSSRAPGVAVTPTWTGVPTIDIPVLPVGDTLVPAMLGNRRSLNSSTFSPHTPCPVSRCLRQMARAASTDSSSTHHGSTSHSDRISRTIGSNSPRRVMTPPKKAPPRRLSPPRAAPLRLCRGGSGQGKWRRRRPPWTPTPPPAVVLRAPPAHPGPRGAQGAGVRGRVGGQGGVDLVGTVLRGFKDRVHLGLHRGRQCGARQGVRQLLLEAVDQGLEAVHLGGDRRHHRQHFVERLHDRIHLSFKGSQGQVDQFPPPFEPVQKMLSQFHVRPSHWFSAYMATTSATASSPATSFTAAATSSRVVGLSPSPVRTPLWSMMRSSVRSS